MVARALWWSWVAETSATEVFRERVAHASAMTVGLCLGQQKPTYPGVWIRRTK